MVIAHNLRQVGGKRDRATEVCSLHIARSDGKADSQDGVKCEQLYKMYYFLLALLYSLSAHASEKREKFFTDDTAKSPRRNPLPYLIMKMKTTSDKWPKNAPLQPHITTPPKRSEEFKITFINHSTFLIQVDGLNILTDPIFSDRASPFSWVGPKRVTPPGLQFEQVPPIDIILISHDHYDHFDLPSIKRIHQRDRPKIFLGLKAGHILSEENFQEMGWWESARYKEAEITFAPAKHSSYRRLFAPNSTLWGSFVVRTKKHTFYFAGDTGYGEHFKQVAARFPKIDFAFLPIGAYAPRHIKKFEHMNPEDALRAHADLNPRVSIGMHWGTFQITEEARTEPKEAILKAGNRSFLVPENGDCLEKAKLILTE